MTLCSLVTLFDPKVIRIRQAASSQAFGGSDSMSRRYLVRLAGERCIMEAVGSVGGIVVTAPLTDKELCYAGVQHEYIYYLMSTFFIKSGIVQRLGYSAFTSLDLKHRKDPGSIPGTGINFLFAYRPPERS
jgi:hypothetical protein